ncbi:ATP-binding protein [Kitasatospora sp. NBC_01246]|uniref:ATP-binding protein n=1 Tax=Kitasatospora sp. NBC_01246 TaxID=2903570 RepID=UPI003FA52CBA
MGLGDQRAAEAALAVSEAATNLCRHADDGSLLLRVIRAETDAGLEFVTIDAGPGMADVSRALTDGMSSAGTLGIGLGAISRLADTFDVHSLPGRGTVLAGLLLDHEGRGPGTGRRRAAGGRADQADQR